MKLIASWSTSLLYFTNAQQGAPETWRLRPQRKREVINHYGFSLAYRNMGRFAAGPLFRLHLDSFHGWYKYRWDEQKVYALSVSTFFERSKTIDFSYIVHLEHQGFLGAPVDDSRQLIPRIETFKTGKHTQNQLMVTINTASQWLPTTR